ncbi:glycogen debranching enzyme-like [Folsomia candida]|uniref:glycogen debranching enzyme-like n=1 Tax=Folsomia candida TaxID=158441 RepID=UPI0016055115|nr:glycogen debranching enzyme-like [Folsomia candida]
MYLRDLGKGQVYINVLFGHSKKSGSGYFLVDPVLRIGKNDKVLALDSICCQTFFPKSLGPLTEWKGCLEVAHQSGYNMIHFTPVQELGKSNSSYSISNQLALNPIFGNDVKFGDVQKIVNDMKEEWGVSSHLIYIKNKG